MTDLRLRNDFIETLTVTENVLDEVEITTGYEDQECGFTINRAHALTLVDHLIKRFGISSDEITTN